MKMSGQLHDLATLPLGKEPLAPINRRLDEPQNPCGHGGEEKKIPSLLLPGIKSQSPHPQSSHYAD